jgi:predicted ribosome-associated RNA-binding protein Tma20
MADASDEPPVGDARRTWLPAASARVLAIGDARRRACATYQNNALHKLEPPTKTQPLKSSERRSLRQELQQQFAPALDAAEAIDVLLPTSKTRAVTRGRQDRTELILVDGVVVLASQEPLDGDAKSRAARKTWVPTPLVLQRCPHAVRQVAVHAPVAHGPLKRGADLYAGGVVGFGRAAATNSWPEALFGSPVAQGELVADRAEINQSLVMLLREPTPSSSARQRHVGGVVSTPFSRSSYCCKHRVEGASTFLPHRSRSARGTRGRPSPSADFRNLPTTWWPTGAAARASTYCSESATASGPTRPWTRRRRRRARLRSPWTPRQPPPRRLRTRSH